MKLCHIVPSLEEQHGGPSKSVRALCGALARAGHDVDLLATHPGAATGGEASTAGGVSLRVFRREWPQRLCVSSGLRDAVTTSDAAVVHHHSLWLRTLHYADAGTRRSRVPLVISPRGMMSDWAWRHHGARKQLARTFVHPGALERATAFHATSEEEEREIRARGFRQPVCVAPNGVSAPAEAEVAAAAAHWRQACPALAGRRVALFYSRFHRKKRVLELIETWLAHAPADWLLLLVGIPEDYTPEAVADHARRRSGAGRVLAFSGVGRPPPYAVASLFLLPSHNENFGLVVAEAMAHGVPVAVTDTTPWRAVQDRALGWCVPWEQFSAAIAAATAETAARLAGRGAAARDWVLQEFSWDRSAAKLLAFYDSLQGGRA